MKRLIFIGPQGAGKGTIAAHVCPKFEIPHISTGDMFREAIEKGTELGKKAKEYMDKGELVPDEITVQLVKERITHKDCYAGFVLDGFPRTIPQAEALDKEVDIDGVILLEAPEELLIERLTTRRQCRNCGKIYNLKTNPPKEEGKCDICGGEVYQRDDDKEEAIKRRLEIYKKETAPIADYYEKQGKLHKVDAARDVDEIVKDVVAIIEKI